MSPKKTLFLAVILLACVLYIARVEFPNRQEAERKGFLFAQLEGVQLESLKIKKTAKDAEVPLLSVSLVNTTPKEKAAPTPTPSKDPAAFPPADLGETEMKSWMIEGIAGAHADILAVRPLISALQSLKLDDPLPPDQIGDDMALFGLKEPVAEITVKRLGLPEKKIFVGAENEYLMKRYLKVDGDPQIYIVSPAIFSAIDKTTNDFREKSPVQLEDLAVSTFKITTSQSSVSLKQTGMGNWSIEEPVAHEASSEAVSKLVSSLSGLRAEEFIDDGAKRLGEFGLDAPAATLDITFKDNSKNPPLKIIAGRKKDDATGIYFSVSGFPTVYRAVGTPMEEFTKSVDDLRSRQLFKFIVDRIKTAEFSGTAVWSMKITNQGNSWKVNDKDGDTVFVDQLFYTLKELPAEQFIKDSSKVDFANPRLTITLKIDGPKAEETMVLTVGQQVPGSEPPQYYARVGDKGEVFTIAEATFKRIRPMEETLIKQPEVEPAVKATPGSK